MCSRHRPEAGADSQTITGFANPDGSGEGNWIDAEPRTESGRALLGYFMDWRPASNPHRPENRIKARRLILAIEHEAAGQCAACSLPAIKEGYCAGHARLGEYRVTDETHWAANE